MSSAVSVDLTPIRAALDAKHYDEALLLALEAVSHDSNDAEAQALFAEAALGVEKWEEALAATDRMLQLKPSAWGWRMRCVALENLGRYDGLIKTYDHPFTAENHDALGENDYIIVHYVGNQIEPVAE